MSLSQTRRIALPDNRQGLLLQLRRHTGQYHNDSRWTEEDRRVQRHMEHNDEQIAMARDYEVVHR